MRLYVNDWLGNRCDVMNQKLITVFILAIFIQAFVAIDLHITEVQGQPMYSKMIVLTYDGARKYWVDALMNNGTLSHLSSLKEEGNEITLRITDHDPKTDPGMACMETGYGPEITGIDSNYFGNPLVNPVIPDGLTITERIKAQYQDEWKMGLIMPWTQDSVNVTENQDSTFWNQRSETDYWFSSENLTWSLSDTMLMENVLSFSSALLKATYLAEKASEFITMYADSSFYLRMHFVEPDYTGHSNGESADNKITAAYEQALVECDIALGMVLTTLQTQGIYNETIVLVSTDHGFKGVGHGPPAFPLGDPDVTETWLIANDPEISNELGWGLQNDLAPTCLALAGIDPSVLTPFYNQTSHALPLWDANLNNREMTKPLFSQLYFSPIVYEGMMFNVTVNIDDQSGIRTAQIRYKYGTIWRTKTLQVLTGITYSTLLGPFSEGMTILWYLQAIDNSSSLNIAFSPENKTASFTVQEAQEDTAPPIFSNVQYPQEPMNGEAIQFQAQVNDESNIQTVRIYYRTNGEWNTEVLLNSGSDIYEITLGPYNSGTVITWYLEALDDSSNNNMGLYCSENEPCTITIAGNDQNTTFLIIGGVVSVLIVLLIVILKFR